MKHFWVGEENGIKLWPQLYLTDIIYIIFDNFMGMYWTKRACIVQRIECQYKQGKAYRYFTGNAVRDVYYNNICNESKYCYLKTKCLPSRQVSSKLYDVMGYCKEIF